MDNEEINSPLNSTINSRNEVKTVYINDIESLNDSTENNDSNFNFYPSKINKSNNNNIKFSDNNTDGNLLINKKDNKNKELKNNPLKQLSRIKKTKEKFEKEKNNNILDNQEEYNKKEKDENDNNKRNKMNYPKNSEEFDKNIVYKLITKNKGRENSLQKKQKETILYNNQNKFKNKKNIYTKVKIIGDVDDINLIKEKKMLKEINFLKNEIQLKDEIIQKLTEENKKLMEKIKSKEIELLNSKNKEENLARVIQENNKCISNLNDLILKLVPQNAQNKQNHFFKNIHISKSGIDKNSLYNILGEKSSNNKQKNKEKKQNKKNKYHYFSNNNIQINKENIDGNNVQRYFKMQTRNNVKKQISSNQKNKLTGISDDENDENKGNYNGNKDNAYLYLDSKKFSRDEKMKRKNTISMNIKKNNYNYNYSDFINDSINNINNKSMKLSTDDNANKKKNYNNIRFNLDLIRDKNNYFNMDYFAGNKSCKNEKIKNLEISPKKFDSHSNVSLNEFFNRNKDYKYKMITSPQVTKINNNLNKSYNLKYIKNMNENKKNLNNKKMLYLNDEYFHNNSNQSFSIKNINYNFQKFLLNNSNINNHKNIDNYSPRNKDIKFISKYSDKFKNNIEKENNNFNIYNNVFNGLIGDKKNINNISTKNSNYNFLIEF